MTRLNHHHHYYYYAADDDLLILQNRFLGVSAKLRKATITFVTYVRPVCQHGKTRLPLDGFPRNLILDYFSKIYRENSSVIQIRQ